MRFALAVVPVVLFACTAESPSPDVPSPVSGAARPVPIVAPIGRVSERSSISVAPPVKIETPAIPAPREATLSCTHVETCSAAPSGVRRLADSPFGPRRDGDHFGLDLAFGRATNGKEIFV